MSWSDEIDIVNLAKILELHEPLSKLFWSDFEAIALVGNSVVLAEHAAEIATGEENRVRAIVALYARFLYRIKCFDIPMLHPLGNP